MSEEFKESTGWNPAPNDVVKGKFIDLTTIEGSDGQYPMLTLEQEDGSEINVHAFHDVLRNEIVRRNPQIGDDLTIKYLGRKGKNNYHAYAVRGGQVAVNWGAFGGDAPPEQPGEPDVPIAAADLPTPPPAPVTVPDDNEPLPF